MWKVYRIFHYLSLDIVLGALALSYFVASILGAEPGWAWYTTLGASVWLIYMGDHVLDAWRHRKKGLRDMHRFIFQYRRIVLYALGVVLILDLFLVFNILPGEMLKLAMILAVLVFLFFAMRHLFRRNRIFFIPGELFVLAFYLAGITLGPVVMRTVVFYAQQWMLLVMVGGILVMNLGIISLYDAGLDSRMGIASLARSLGRKGTRGLVLFTGTGVILMAILQFLSDGNGAVTRQSFILLGMALILLVILLSPSYFRKREAYRLAADAVLFLGFLAALV